MVILVTEDGTTWKNLVDIDDLKGEPGQNGVGVDGKQVQFQVTETHIQWRYVGESSWKDLIELEELKGEPGDEYTIEADGYWYKNGEKTEYMAENKRLCTITYTLDVNCSFPADVGNTTKVVYGENIAEMPIPTNDFGYEFDGWYSTTNGKITANDGKVTTITTITRDIAVKAVFKGFGKTHSTADGLVYENYNELKSYTGDSSEITIPRATTKFESNFGNENIKTINVYQTTLHLDIDVKRWGWSFDETAFVNLECINILNDTKASGELTIADIAFKNLVNLKKVVYDDDLYVSYIGAYAFSGCTSLNNFSHSATESGKALIEGEGGLVDTGKSIVLSSGAFDNTLITNIWIYGSIADNLHNSESAFMFAEQIVEIRYYGGDLTNNENDKFIKLPSIDGKHWEDEDGNTITQFSAYGVYTLVQDYYSLRVLKTILYKIVFFYYY